MNPDEKKVIKADEPLTERKKSILRAIVQDYVESAEPVGSKALLTRHQLGISSATVRNEMAELEEEGYLEQPHTSSGRVPSDKGYRAYVDDMLTLREIPETDKQRLEEELEANVHEIQSLIRQAAGVLSEETELASLVLTPTYGSSTLRQIKILMIEPGRALVVVVLSAGIVRDRLIQVPGSLSQEQLREIAEAVEKHLSGRKLEDISLVTVTDAGQQEAIPDVLLNQVLFETYLSIKQAENIDVYLQGSHRLLEQPEFSDVKKAHRFLNTMNQNGLVAGYLSELQDDVRAEEGQPAYAVRIGQEIALEGMEDCSFVSSSYRIGHEIRGKIAVIGPKRMLYSKIISDVSFINQSLNRLIRRGLGGQMKEGWEDEDKM